MKSALMPLTSQCVADTLPGGQQKPFPENQFALMTGTGAKGGNVNFSQISVMLGQQELEGRRVARLVEASRLAPHQTAPLAPPGADWAPPPPPARARARRC